MASTKTKPAPPRQLVQPTSFGNPPTIRNYRFYRFAGAILQSANGYLRVLTIASALLSVALAIYAGLFIEHSTLYASDGSLFSCALKSKTK